MKERRVGEEEGLRFKMEVYKANSSHVLVHSPNRVQWDVKAHSNEELFTCFSPERL